MFRSKLELAQLVFEYKCELIQTKRQLGKITKRKELKKNVNTN